MAEERCRAEWGQTSSLMALVANLARNPDKTNPAEPDDFNPFVKRERIILPLTVLKAWCKK